MKKQFMQFVICAFLFVIFSTNLIGQDVSLKDKRITLHIENASFGTIVGDLINKYDIAIGFEESTLDSKRFDYLFETNLPFDDGNCEVFHTNHSPNTKCEPIVFPVREIKFTVNVDNEPLENVLNLLIFKMQNYKWEINDDVVNIIPIIGRDKRFEELLSVKIQNISLLKERRIQSIPGIIFRTPEVFAFFKANNVGIQLPASSSHNTVRELKDDLFFSNLTLRELLNKITKAKRGGWALKQTNFSRVNKTKNEFINIDI